MDWVLGCTASDVDCTIIAGANGKAKHVNFGWQEFKLHPLIIMMY